MTATSPYAPLRRQSSVGGGRMLRRSSSTGVVVANGGAAYLLWYFFQFWKRIISPNSNDAGGDSASCNGLDRGGRIHEFLNTMAGMVSSNLVIDPHHAHNENGSDELSTPLSRRNRGISAVLRWLVTIMGGDQSKLGRIIVIIVGFAREVLLRSIGAANILLTGAPQLSHLSVDNTTIRMNDSLSGLFKPVSNGCGKDDKLTERGASPTNKETEMGTVRQDRLQIDQVLNYWFGRASPNGAQKTLWMIASSSVELLNQVDEEISLKFRSLVIDLASSSASSTDQGKLQRWTKDEEIFGWHGKMAAIIALDQMSRHIHRYDKNHTDESIQIIPEQQQLDSLAYAIAKTLQSHHQKELFTGMVPLPMRIFGIMPLRHASTVEDLSIVQKDVESASELHDEMDNMISRFRKATNRRMAALQDEARREGKLGLQDEDAEERRGGADDQQFDDEMILECFPFKADMSKACDHMVVKTIRTFLSKMNIVQISDGRSKSSRKTAHSVKNNKQSPMAPAASNHVPTAIVSLSGGVDSMVIASALAYLRDAEASRQNTNPENILRIIGIHIDYANRPESGAEAAYVGRYCQEVGATFICRKIDEVTRGVTARDDYEKIAREIRFDLYRESCAKASSGTKEGGIGVMLGHHRGDLRENVISNAHKGCGPLDLSGMTAVSKNNGVNLFRPLLPLEKSHIFDYSHTFGVPYFKDTTPNWSTRGKLRSRLLPLLEEIYGEGSMDNLSSLAEESDDARALIQQTAMGPFMEQVKRYPMGITFETSPWKNFGLFFWKFVVRQVLHSVGLGMFSDKSVGSFLERVQATRLKEGWLQCRKDYAVFLQKDGRVFIFYPTSFPFGNGQKKGQCGATSNFIGYGSESSMKVGPWTISSEIIEAANETQANAMLQTKALDNMEHLMAGDIRYFMKVPIMIETTLPCPLIRVKGYSKPTRPAAWKGFDLRVESTLPLLGVDHSVLDDEVDYRPQEYEKTWALIEVRLLLNSEKANRRKMKPNGGSVPVPRDDAKPGAKDDNDAHENDDNEDESVLIGNKCAGASTEAPENDDKANHDNDSQGSPDKMRGLVLGLLMGDLGVTENGLN